jgi:NAD(P)-dependent dehydrogenase (short-subunit alcohol dehydrogenase family)
MGEPMALLEDKVAVITGAGNGIGREVALLFGREGAHVVVNDAGVEADGSGGDPAVARSVAAEIELAGGSALASADSVADAAGVSALFEATKARYGGVDILVCCAGIHRDKPLLALSHADFDAVLDVQLRSSLLCAQAAARSMKTRGGGSIVFTTAMSGMFGNYGQATAAAAHAGVYGLMRTASIELQRADVRVNAVAPLAKTRQTRDLPVFEQVESMQPAHVAPVYLFLASGLSAEVSGTVVGVAGGRLSTFRVVESPGKFKETENGIWRATEIAEHFATLRRS